MSSAWFVALVSRRSAAWLGGIAVAALTVWQAIFTMSPGLRLWPDLVTGLSASTVYTGALAAGVVAFEAGRWKDSQGTRERFGARSSVQARALHFVGLAAPLVGGYLLALIVLGVFAQVTGVYGSPDPFWLVAVGAAIVGACGVGYAIGALFGGRWYVPPAGALCFYASFIVTRSSGLPYGVQSLFPFITNQDTIFVRDIEATMVGQTVCWLAAAILVAVLAGLPSRRTVGRWSITLGAVLVLLTSLGAATVLVTNGQYTTGHNPGVFVCKSGTVTLCLNPGYAVAIPAIYSQFVRLDALTAGTKLAPHRLEQNVQGIGDDPSHGARSVYLEQFGSKTDVEFAVYRYVTTYGAMPACEAVYSNTPTATLDATTYVDAWLSGYSYAASGMSDLKPLHRLQALTAAQGNQWFIAHWRRYSTCSLKLSDLP